MTPAAARPDIVVADTVAALVETAAGSIRGLAADAIAARGRFRIALAGGSTPRALYPHLVGGIDWTRTDVFFGDERAVPPDDPESNFRMASEALLQRVPIPGPSVHRMEAEAADADAAAARYAGLLPQALDVLVLGVGADGHTASLFPGSPALRERSRRVVPATAPKPPQRRLTITPPVIAAARRIVVLAAGSDKAGPVARALKAAGTPDEVPARLARDGVWFLDRAAAGLLTD